METMPYKLFNYPLYSLVKILSGQYAGKTAEIIDRWHRGYKQNYYALNLKDWDSDVSVGYIHESEIGAI